MKANVLAFAVAAFAAQTIPAAAVEDGTDNHAAEVSALRKAFCAAKDGIDITNLGALEVGDNVRAVVICHIPEKYDKKDDVGSYAALGPGLPGSLLTVELAPPAGTFTITDADPAFTAGCSADLYIAPASWTPPVSHGTSTLSCRGYNAGSGSLGCSVQWSGPTDVTVGVQPYGGRVEVNFTCVALHLGSFSTQMDYSYRDPLYPTLFHDSRNVPGTITVTQ